MSEYDFSVNASKDAAEYPLSVRAAYVGIYTLTLNRTISIEFVPRFERLPWPPAAADNMDDVRTCDEARRSIVATSRYVVTPDEMRRGTIETFSRPMPDRLESLSTTLYYIGEAEFANAAREIEDLATRLTAVYDSVHVSDLAETEIARILIDKIIPSGKLSDYAIQTLKVHVPR